MAALNVSRLSPPRVCVQQMTHPPTHRAGPRRAARIPDTPLHPTQPSFPPWPAAPAQPELCHSHGGEPADQGGHLRAARGTEGGRCSGSPQRSQPWQRVTPHPPHCGGHVCSSLCKLWAANHATFSSARFSRSVVSDSLQPRGPQHEPPPAWDA